MRDVLFAPRDRGLDAIERHSLFRELPDALAGQIERTTDAAAGFGYFHGSVLALRGYAGSIPHIASESAHLFPVNAVNAKS